jgi:hypothetical protein
MMRISTHVDEFPFPLFFLLSCAIEQNHHRDNGEMNERELLFINTNRRHDFIFCNKSSSVVVSTSTLRLNIFFFRYTKPSKKKRRGEEKSTDTHIPVRLALFTQQHRVE